MLDTEALRETITTALADQIGLYTFSTGETTAAIRVDDGADPYEENPTASGLEVVIQPILETSIVQMMGGYQQTFSVLIVLKQWDIEETTIEAMLALMPYLHSLDELNVGAVRRIVRSSKLDNIETLTIQASQVFYIESYLD